MLDIPPEVIERLECIRVKPGRFGADSWIAVERRDGFKGTRWAVVDDGLCLGNDGKWSKEPMPSSRTPKWLARNRFATFAAAWEAAEQCRPHEYHPEASRA